MGLMDRIKKATGTEDYNDYDDTYYDEFDDGNEAADAQQNAVDPMANMGAASMGGGISLSGTALELKVVKPQNFESVAQIADHLLNKRTVVLNLENTNKETARRLIDFLSGVAYSIDGALKKIDVAVYEAAESLGCSGIKKVFTVVLPLVLPTAVAAALLVFMNCMADFGTPALIGEGYDAIIVQSPKGLYRVICASYDSRSEAAEARARFKAAHPDNADYQKAWLLYNK